MKPKFTKEQYSTDPVFQRLQFEVRAAFEEAYMASNHNRGKSDINPDKGKWFDYWINSRARDFLITNGLMTGDECYK